MRLAHSPPPLDKFIWQKPWMVREPVAPSDCLLVGRPVLESLAPSTGAADNAIKVILFRRTAAAVELS